MIDQSELSVTESRIKIKKKKAHTAWWNLWAVFCCEWRGSRRSDGSVLRMDPWGLLVPQIQLLLGSPFAHSPSHSQNLKCRIGGLTLLRGSMVNNPPWHLSFILTSCLPSHILPDAEVTGTDEPERAHPGSCQYCSEFLQTAHYVSLGKTIRLQFWWFSHFQIKWRITCTFMSWENSPSS